MQIVIEKTKTGFRQTTKEKVDGRVKIRRTNNLKRITRLISQLPNNPCLVQLDKKDIKVIYSSDQVLLLKDYQNNLSLKLYNQILDNIDENTPIVKNVKTNRKKILAIALASITLISVSGIAISMISKATNNIDNQQTVAISETSSWPIEENEETYTSSMAETLELPDDDNYDNSSIVQAEIISKDNYELETRILQTKNIYNNSLQNNKEIPISTKMDDYTIDKIVNFINSADGKYTFQLAQEFGVDPYTFVCLMMNESSLNHEGTIPGGQYYNGFGVGICQLETPNGQEITAFNYDTNQSETIYETMDNALDKRLNIKMGIMRYQNVLQRYHGNEKLALQSYNFGYGLIDLIVQIYADEIGVSFDDVVDNYQDVGWLKYVQQVSSNPQAFAQKLDTDKYSNYSGTINYLKKWQYDSYGNGNYLKNLYSYYLGIYSSNIINGEIIQTNLTDNNVVKVSLEDSKKNLI